MKILERIKKGLSEFNKALGPDIEDENENEKSSVSNSIHNIFSLCIFQNDNKLDWRKSS